MDLGIDWNKQALEFMKLHGWEQNQFEFTTAYFHKCFPLGEDVSTPDGALKFCESFYGEAWKAHRAYIEGEVILSQEEIKGDKLED